MYEIILTIYIAFIGSLGTFLLNNIINNSNRKRVTFCNNIEIIYFDRVDNKCDYWYTANDYERFYKETFILDINK